MKQRITALDLRILVSELQNQIKGYRLSNVYSLASNNRSFLFKFALPDSKINVISESGFKIYRTEYQHPTLPQPSSFCTKLRKHLKSKRLTNIKQIGNDRIAVMEFGDGFYYLVFEFFSAGNIILLDSDLKLLSLFRVVENKAKLDQQDGGFDYSVGQVYPAFDKSLFEKESTEEMHTFTSKELIGWVDESKERQAEAVKARASGKKKKKVRVPSIAKLCFIHAAYLSSDLIQISLLNAGIKSSDAFSTITEESAPKIVASLQQAETKLHSILSSSVEGYILMKKNALFDATKEEGDDNLKFTYEEFHPYEPTHKENEDTKVEAVKGYNKTLDRFFTMIEQSKASLARQQKEAAAAKRLQTVKDENAKKVAHLAEMQETNSEKGRLITLHTAEIEECRASVQALINQQMDWQNIDKLIKIEQTRGNPIAKMIKSLNLIRNQITVALPKEEEEIESPNESESESETDDSESDDDSDSDVSTKNTINVVIDITQSAFANSSRYFDAKKSAEEKQIRTAKSSAIALKNSENKIAEDMKKLQRQSKHNVEIKKLRPKFWFEKFFWFISGDGYLCIAGKDDIQVDTIYYRYFNNASDVLVSNNLDHALKVVVKNPFKNHDIAPTTLIQAGIYSLTTTKAWEGKMSSSPWFVPGCDVSKKDFDGSILPPGMLNIAKEKTFLPPSQMNMGIGLLWIPDEATGKKHIDAQMNRNKDIGFEYVESNEGSAMKAKELKAMLEKLEKKEKKADAEEREVEEDENVEVEEEASDIPEPTADEQVQTKIRGKKSKMKKIKKKYGDQDEAERRLRMAVLGTLKQVKETKSKTESKKIENVKSERQKKIDARTRKEKKVQQQIHQLYRILEEVEEAQQENTGSDNRNIRYYRELCQLIKAPFKTDTITDCIVVFMPWPALNRYTYKVKVMPGNLKKGKTLNGAIDYFKKETKSLLKKGADWADKEGIVNGINEQDYMMSLTGSRYKLATSGSDNRGKGNKKHGKKGGRRKKK